jgi:Iron-sulphur cluster biosynthesis.
MKVFAPESAINALKEIIADNQDKPSSVRVYFAGFSCSGASFALALDNEIEGQDVSCDLEGIHFIMDQDEFLTYGNVIIQEIPNRGFVVKVEHMPSNEGGGCSGCSGGCDC